ncbi:MAG: DUF5658 family protein [Gemmatimonadales bacterium]
MEALLVRENIEGGAQSVPLYIEVERRRFPDRRRLTFRTILRSGVTPRRRNGRRRGDRDGVVDWHEPDLMFLALTILLLSITDAFFTVTLLANGATEINPLLAYVFQHFPAYFPIFKMTLTGVGVVVLVVMARARVFRIVRVKTILQFILAGYVALIAYEVWMMNTVL